MTKTRRDFDVVRVDPAMKGSHIPVPSLVE